MKINKLEKLLIETFEGFEIVIENPLLERGIVFPRDVYFEPVANDEYTKNVFKMADDISEDSLLYLFNINPNTYTGYVNTKFISIIDRLKSKHNCRTVYELIYHVIDLKKLSEIINMYIGFNDVDEMQFDHFKSCVDSYFNTLINDLDVPSKPINLYKITLETKFNETFALIIVDSNGDEMLIKYDGKKVI